MELRRDVFQAIADPTRREIITLISRQSLNLNAVAENFDISRQAISLHIKILEECGLIFIKQVSGTWRTDRNPSSEIGMLVHIMVDDMEETIKKVKDHGGTIVQPVGMDAPEITAHFRDPLLFLLSLPYHPP